MFFDRYRPNLNKFVPMVAVCPMSTMAMPVSVIVIMPVFVIPVVIPTIFVGSHRKRSTNNRSEDAYGQDYLFHT